MVESTTDVSPTSETGETDVVQDGSKPPNGEAAPETHKPGEVDPNNKRGGKSRSELRAEKIEKFIDKAVAKEEGDARTSKFEEITSKIGESQKAETKSSYDAEVKRLTELGVSEDKAHDIAIDSVQKNITSTEEARKEAGRNNTQLPPTGNGTVSNQTVYLNSELAKMPTEQAVAIRRQAHAGQVSIKMD